MRALRAQGMSRDDLPYKAFWQPWFSYYGMTFNIIIILTQGFTAFMPWDTSSFFVAYVSLIIFAVLYIGHKLVFRQPFVKPEEADLDSGRREVDEMYFEEKVPTTIWGKFWAWMG
ncbi:lysine permease [Extremus antarcticus]|uniref:Lysine permease n=1 Tax=Extremus antarcticus TaxID=702011 RepID=A0AAJ0DG50_9PEZI|nr:lysine permease [Extremus antarcticus]